MKNSPAIQAANLVRYIGDRIYATGEPIQQLRLAEICEAVGASSHEFAFQLITELKSLGVVKMEETAFVGRHTVLFNVNLTLEGWSQYEREKRGGFSANYGFIAMQFGDPKLDPFVQNVVKPAVKQGVAHDLVDMRDVAKAGIVDNIMRIQIRDSAFVIVDLTHDNPGAYWEAGYAEGLGKPVIYICERSKFDEKSTHFDTNHCTTIPWSMDEVENFKQELVATLRRSLDLHD